MLREIQYLRAIAILMVLYGHATFIADVLGFSPYFSGMAEAGVDIFFVISGYVVGKNLFEILQLKAKAGFITNLEHNIPAIKGFFCRRIFRLFPVALLLIVVEILAKRIMPSFETNITEEIMGLLSHITMQSDMDFVLFSSTTKVFRKMYHFWSLAAEERFYIFAPFLILLCASPRRFMSWAVGIIVALSLFKALYPMDWFALYHNGFLRFDAFMFGILVYLLEAHTHVMQLFFNKRQNRIGMNLLAILLIIICARLPIAQITGTQRLEFSGTAYYFLCNYTLSAILIAMAAQNKGYVLNIPGLRSVLFWIGNRSYIIYVFHLFCLDVACRLAINWGIPLDQKVRYDVIFIIVLGLTCELIHRLWENPWRVVGRRIAARIDAHIETVPPASFT